MLSVRGQLGRDGRLTDQPSEQCTHQSSGGGELLEQGTQLIDLARLILGDFHRASGRVYSQLWSSDCGNNVYLHLETANGQVASLHANATECQDRFCLEIVGETGKLEIHGLCGTASVQRLTWYRHTELLGTPERVDWEYPGQDLSMQREMLEFFDDIRQHRQSGPNLDDALATLTVAETVYRNLGTEQPTFSVSTLTSLQQTRSLKS